MKQLFRFVVLAILSIAPCIQIIAQAPQLQWANVIASTGAMSAPVVGVDSQKNLYVAGAPSAELPTSIRARALRPLPLIPDWVKATATSH